MVKPEAITSGFYLQFNMATQYSIDDAKKLFSDRAGTRGISSNVPPDKFNRWWNSAELKFFNERYDDYSKRQTISDSISKWMTDPLYIPIQANGLFPFFANMNMLHVDSMSAYLVSAGTMIATLGTLTGGTGYTNGSYYLPLTGGSGTGATAFIIVVGGIVVAAFPSQQGSGYAVGNTLTASISGGSGFSIQVASLTGSVKEYPIERVEKQRVATHLSSEFEPPTQEFPIYTQFSNSFQFYPKNIGFAKTVILQQPIWSVWAYHLYGYIGTLTALVGGSSYTNGTYTNVPLTGGSGSAALAIVVVAGNVVTGVTITNPGKLYAIGDTLSAASGNIGGTGTGFSINVSSLVAGSVRPVYDPTNSIQPLWSNDDISTIIDLALADAAIAARDKELSGFANATNKTLQ